MDFDINITITQHKHWFATLTAILQQHHVNIDLQHRLQYFCDLTKNMHNYLNGILHVNIATRKTTHCCKVAAILFCLLGSHKEGIEEVASICSISNLKLNEIANELHFYVFVLNIVKNKAERKCFT